MCGIVGLYRYSKKSQIGISLEKQEHREEVIFRPLAQEALLALTTLQHRGQDAAGILTLNQTGFQCVKNLGLVESVFSRQNIESLTGNAAIAHARYSTSGRRSLDEVQPFTMGYPYGIGFVHNGNLVNTPALTQLLKQKFRRQTMSESDTEVLLHLFSEGLSQSAQSEITHESVVRAVRFVSEHAKGSYSCIALISGYGLVAFRDPWGIRPLVFGERSDGMMFASESVSLDFLGYQKKRDVAAGEVITLSEKGFQSTIFATHLKFRPCMFEWVYFASPESEVDGAPVYQARIELGRSLGKKVHQELSRRNLTIDYVVPVPETARIAAISLSEEMNVPYRELLIKNRYVKRTFILETQDIRENAVRLKLSPVKSEIRGKNILLVDDSIVRGTTSKKLVELVRSAGAKSVVFVSTCPPIQYPCFYGIDFQNSKSLLAHKRSLEEIEKELGADAVIYQSIEGLTRALIPNQSPCMACLDGDYLHDH